jgi:succinate dehydrogenase hydrophobic anchor subunit
MRFFKMQRYTAIALIFFMSLHMIVVHYPPGTIDFSRVMERLVNPVWKVIDIVFLAVVLLHGLGGLYDVVIDSERVMVLRKPVAGVIVVIGLVAFVYGTVTILSFNEAALAALR